MPPSMKSNEAPALVLIDNAGKSALVNYRVRGSYYIVDKLFDRAALIVGVGNDQQKVDITRKTGGVFSWLR
jgi:type IV secretory pathway VirB9-like protein